MASPSADVDSLEQLESPEQVRLLDAMDRLRKQGLDKHEIGIPQLIVCGEQSSGKSSVLEGLTRLRFPTKDGLCTTFATELILRRQPTVQIVCTIKPGKNRSKDEKDELGKFIRVFSSREEFAFPALIDEAEEQMEVGTKSDQGPFFEDTLQIKYTGPEVPSLTFVDLPGIIQSEIEGQRGVKTVRALVQRYMAEESSIILAIVSARNDLENQSVLDYVKRFDPSGSRTLGIITKPDTLDVGSQSETRFVRLVQNQVMPLDLGWHAVRNRGFGTSNHTDAERDDCEQKFFASGPWAPLPRRDVGIETLREKLSRVLLQHIRQELPSLNEAIQNAIVETEAGLKELGAPRDQEPQQRNFLMEKAGRFHRLTEDALRGIYQDQFFELRSMDSIPPTRLRSQIQDLNLAFAHAMYTKGHQYQIIVGQRSSSSEVPPLYSSAIRNYDALPDPINIARNKFLEEHIGTQVRLSRSSGLTSLVNPWVIGATFRQQSKPWEAIAQSHLRDVFEAVMDYLHECLGHMMDQETFYALMQEQILPELERRRDRLGAKLEEILIQYQKFEPMIYDPSFQVDLDQARARRQSEPQVQVQYGGPHNRVITQLLVESPNDFTTSEILDLTNTYYQKSIPVFISNVTVLAIEQCLISNLPSLLSPELVSNMDTEKLRIIASESDEIRAKRATLKQKLEDLREGKRVLESQACRLGRGMRNTVRKEKRTSNAPVAHDYRPTTPTSRPDDPIDNLASGLTTLNVTPQSTPRNTGYVSQSQGAPITPPKSPKPQIVEPPHRWMMRADTLPDSGDEL